MKRNRKTILVTLTVILIGSLLAASLAGCGTDAGAESNRLGDSQQTGSPEPNNQLDPGDQDPDTSVSSEPVEGAGEGTQPSISPNLKTDNKTVTLYFSDDQAINVVPEKRTVTVKQNRLAQAIVEALLDGPKTKGLVNPFPKDVKLLSVERKDDILYVNFSREIQQGAGSAGEIMTIQAVVFSLTELPGVEKVQFLIEGQKQETLSGHIYAMEPIARTVAEGSVYNAIERIEQLQKEADAGDSTLLDPVRAARVEGKRVGFRGDESYKLVSFTEIGEYSGMGMAVVEVKGKTASYRVQMVQPAKQGKAGIWLINDLQRQ